jgi:uncharacterized protein YjbI with pentapeptide repeats
MKTLHRYTNACLWEGEAATMRDAVIAATKAGANLSWASLSGADLSWANLSWASLSWASLSWANLSGANLYRADLSGASLSGASLYRADLSGADLSGADLSGANLSGANFSGANFYRADLSGADLSGANLSGAKIRRIMSLGPIGSRNATLVVWCMEDGSYRYSTGCQIQITEEEFRDRIVSAHGGNEHGCAYMEAIQFAHRLNEVYTPVVEVKK